ncbi:MAG: DNA methyltransferase [Anaerolineales bacterium]
MAAKRPYRNRLNDLAPRDWLLFQKSWFVHNPPRRRREVLRHPAKFPETLAQEFIRFFTKKGQMVFDPMVGTGSTVIAALREGRSAVGIELNPAYAEIALGLVNEERQTLGAAAEGFRGEILVADAAHMRGLDLPLFDYVLTSPPYWDMLRARGATTQRSRRRRSDLDVFYSDDPADLGNITDYAEFLDRLVGVYAGLDALLRPGAYLTIIVKNIKKGGRLYPLAWDLGLRLQSWYALKDERIWCQDDVRLAPYGLGNAWVSNTVHHYCLQFRKPEPAR